MLHSAWLRAILAFFSSIATSQAQQYVISTVAGGAPTPTPSVALSVPIGQSQAVATDSSGNIFFASFNCILKLDPSGTLTRIAGTGKPGYAGDGGPATSAVLNAPRGIAVDSTGNIFIADSGNNRIRRVSANGVIATVAGTGVAGFSGDGGSAVNAELNAPTGVAVDNSGHIYIADSVNNRVRGFATAGIITTVVGNGTAAQLNYPIGVAADNSGDVFIADSNDQRILEVSADGAVSTRATGTAAPGEPGGGPNAQPCLSSILFPKICGPTGVAVDLSGNLYVADTFGNRVLEVSPNGTVTEPAGGVTTPWSVAADGQGNILIASGTNYILKASAAGLISQIAGNGLAAFAGDGGPAASAQLSEPGGLTIDGSGNLFFTDSHGFREISANGIITTNANPPPGYLIANNSVQKVEADGSVTTIAGNGSGGFSGDGGPAINAQLSGPAAVVADPAGDIFIADKGNFRVRKVSASGIITTVAGNGTPGFSGDGGLATNATMYGPFGLAVDNSGNLFIADNYRVREVNTSGIIMTVAGNGGQSFFPTGDGGLAVDAQLFPNGIAVDSQGNLFISVLGTNSVRKVSTDGIITTVAGNGTAGYSGDGGPGQYGQMNMPSYAVPDGSGNLYIVDSGNNAIRKLTPVSQSVLISAVLDAAAESASPISPGKIIAIYGTGLGPATGVTASPSNGFFGTQLTGTTVSVNGVAAPVYYASTNQVNAIVPYATSGTTANITVAWQGSISSAFAVPVAPASPGLFSYNSTGAGQAAAVNVVDGTLNTATNPVKIGAYISLYATGEGQTLPAGADGKLAIVPLPSPVLPVTATVGGVPAIVQYQGAVPGEVAGLMQVNVLIPAGVTPGGYIPVVLTVGNTSTVNGAMWIAVSN